MSSQLIRKNPDARKDWRQEGKGTTEDEVVEWHHWLNGHESEQALWDGEGQGYLACCSPWGRKESDTTEWPNWTELKDIREEAPAVVQARDNKDWDFVTRNRNRKAATRNQRSRIWDWLWPYVVSPSHVLPLSFLNCKETGLGKSCLSQSYFPSGNPGRHWAWSLWKWTEIPHDSS